MHKTAKEVGAMTQQSLIQLRHLEGRRVALVLTDGTCILDAQLISAGRPGLSSVWILVDGSDAFIPVISLAEMAEFAPANPPRAA